MVRSKILLWVNIFQDTFSQHLSGCRGVSKDRLLSKLEIVLILRIHSLIMHFMYNVNTDVYTAFWLYVTVA